MYWIGQLQRSRNVPTRWNLRVAPLNLLIPMLSHPLRPNSTIFYPATVFSPLQSVLHSQEYFVIVQIEMTQRSPYSTSLNVFNSTTFNHHQGKIESPLDTHLTNKELKCLLTQQIELGRLKDQEIQRAKNYQRELEEEVIQAEERLKNMEKQVEELSKMQEEEQEKTEEEKEQQMHMIQNALKIQQQVFGMFQGFSEEVISSIPIFEYNRGLTDEEICLSCFQQFEEGTNVKCLSCCHSFHEKCINESLAASKYCPACSQEVIIY